MLLVQPKRVQYGIIPTSHKLVSHMRPISKVHPRPAIHVVYPIGDLWWEGGRVGVVAVVVTAYAVGYVDREGGVRIARWVGLVCALAGGEGGR